MKAVEVILILAGTFLCVLFFALLTLCRYLRNKKRDKPNDDHKVIFKYPKILINELEVQLPSETCKSGSLFENEWVHSFGQKGSPIIVVSDGNHPKFSKWLDHDGPLVVRERSSSQIELKQRKISLGAMQQLEKQGKRVRNSDLRLHSEQSKDDKDNSPCENYSLDNDVEYISTDSLLSDSDQSWSNFSATSVECNKKHLHGIKKRIASNRRNNQTRLLKKKKIGTIAMKTKFLSCTNTLEVWISQVTYFNNKKQNCCHSFFVLLSLMPEKMQAQTSKRVKDSSEFNFNEQFFFYNINVTQLNSYMLEIKIIKYNKIKKFQNEVIGEAQIPITDLCFSSEESNISFDLFWHFKSKASLGSINISLCHQATISKLNVIIIQAKSLPKFSNPYVTVSLFREETLEMKNTSKKYNMRDPIFNESIEFDISTDVSNPLSVYTMVVTVNDLSFLGKNRVIGHVIFSLFSPQKTAVTHWQIVQNSPYQPHSEWHTLIDPNEI